MKKLFSIITIAVLSFGISKAQTVLFSENFASGVPASWYNGGTAAGVANVHAKWERATNATHGSPLNYNAPGLGVITSPTRSNGYISFNSDSLDLDASGSFGTGNGLASTPQHVELAIPGINVAGHPKLRLQFYQYLAKFQSSTYLYLSTDSTNWTIDTLNSALATNGTTALADEKVSLDISNIVNGQNKLYIKFVIDANLYFWDLDDISVISLPNYDLKDLGTKGVQIGASGLNLFYSSIPASQADSFAAVTRYANTGGLDQSNAVLQLKSLYNPSFTTGTYAQYGSTYVTSPTVAVLPYAKDTVDANIFQTQGIGRYLVAAYVTSDSTDYDPSDNRDSLRFAVTDSVFSISTSATPNGAYFITRNNFSLNTSDGVVYQVDAADTVTSITTALEGGNSTGTHAGAVVQATIYSVAVATTDLSITSPVVSTIAKTVASSDITTSANTTVKPITLKIDNSSGNAVLQPGLYYVAITATPAPGDSNVVIETTPYQANAFPAGLDQTGGVGFFSSTDAPYAIMNFGHSASLLYVSWTRNPATSYLKTFHGVTFTANTNASLNATYAWTVTGYQSGVSQTYGPTPFKTFKDTFTVADSFQVCVTVTDNGNSAQYCGVVKVQDNTGINDLAALNQVALVPNPTSGNVTINADEVNGIVSINVVNLLGEVVKTYIEESNGTFSKSYNMSELSNGVYLIKISNAGSTVTKKLTISK